MENHSIVYKVVTSKSFSTSAPPPWRRKYIIGEEVSGHQGTPIIAFASLIAALRFADPTDIIYIAIATRVRKPEHRYRAAIYKDSPQQLEYYWKDPTLFEVAPWPRETVLCDSLTPRITITPEMVETFARDLMAW